MTAMYSMNHTSFSCSSAAAGSSAHMIPNLDTVSILAVSICVLPEIRIISAET